MELVAENTVLEVGKFYNVRCAELLNESGNVIEYVPVIGDIHRDPQFGFEDKHVHIDGRFYSSIVDKCGLTNIVLVHADYSPKYSNWFKNIVIRKRKCRRLTTGLKPPLFAKRYEAWYDSMIGKSCAGKKCPHMGMTMLEQNGILICPLHSLRGSIKKEIIIPR